MATGFTPPAVSASERLVDDAILKVVWRQIGGNWKSLGRELRIPESKLESIFLQYSTQGIEEMAFQMMRLWTQTACTNATVSFLTERLQEVGRKDLADEILKMPPESSNGNRYPNQVQELSEAEWLNRRLCEKYEAYVMKGLPWMGNMRISLADYYVDLSVETDDNDNTRMPSNRRKGDSTIVANEVFQSAFSSHKRPFRVLVEGPPGYGKTTLSAKLCFDHASSADHIKNFDLVLHFPLRSFEGSLEEMFCRAADLADSHERERFLGILNNSSTRILLLLDGFDEVPQQHVKPILALLRGQRFPNVAVVVTSRPGHFTSDKWEAESDGYSAQCEFTRDWNRLWQSRITILGINKEMKALFIDKHLAKFPENIRRDVSSQLKQLEYNDIIESKFLECPLFLLMLILLATDEETGGIHNLRTPTDLYKGVFHFIIRRYCSKQNEPPKPLYTNLLSKLIRTTIDLPRRFYSYIIHRFWTDQKVATSKEVDLFTVGECTKPFYVDLLCQFGEFALWALTENKLSFSQEEILGSIPQRNPRILELGLLTQSVSMVGFREKVVYEPVHKSLLEFSAAYALWMQCPDGERAVWDEKVVRLWRCNRSDPFSLIMLAGLMRDSFLALLNALNPYANCGVWRWLRHSVNKTELTESVLSSLTPFLPTHWEQWNEEDCLSRTQHDALLLHGIRQGRIQQVRLTGLLATPMPDDVVVDTAVFSKIKNTEENVHKFNCRRLVFDDSNIRRGLNTWIPSIDLQTVSFEFCGDVSSDLHWLRSALTAGALKDIQIQIRCEIMETPAVVALTELIKMEKLKALDLHGVPSGSEEVNGLLRAAANSSQLTTLLLQDWRGASVDLCHLCGGVQKTWQFLSITGFTFDFPRQTDQSCLANCLVLHCPDTPAALLRFLEVCQVTSLQCRSPLLAHVETLPLLPQHLTELNVLLEWTTKQCRLPHLPNLTVLIFTMHDDGPGSFSFRDFLFKSRSFLRLKGIEIWQAGWNEKLSMEFVKCVSVCLEQSSSHSLQLGYFLMQSANEYDDFLAPLGDMAAHLRNKSLSRLDIVGRCSPDLLDLFSSGQGYRVETNLWGTRSEDTILRRMEYDTQHSLFNCYSIRHSDN